MDENLSPEQTKLTVLIDENDIRGMPAAVALRDESHAYNIRLMEVQLYRKGEEWIYGSLMLHATDIGNFLDTTVEMKAHAFKIAAACPYVREKLQEMYMEGEMDLSNPIPLALPIDGRVLKHVLEYMYLGTLKVNASLAYSLLQACHILQLYSAKSLLGDWLGEHINSSNALKMYVASSRFDCASLEKHAGMYVDENFLALTQTKDWQFLEEAQVREILQRDQLVVSQEIEVPRALVRWAEYGAENEGHGGAGLEVPNRRQAFERLMLDRKAVRLPYQEEGKVVNPGRTRPRSTMGLNFSRLSTRVSRLVKRGGSHRDSFVS